MDIQDVLRGIRFHAKRHPEPYNSWADTIEAAMGDPVMKMVWERDAEIERLRDALAHYATDESADGWVAIAALKLNPTP